jgi:phage terminase large subunit GpA-like protein
MFQSLLAKRDAALSFTPPPKLKLSEWVDAHLRLPEGVSALPGKVRLWPYQRGIADAISDPAIERITMVKPVRVGFTMLLTSTIASYVANEPSPILALMPTEDDCRDYVVSELEPIFAATPVLRGLISADADESGRNTLMSRRFPGGSLKIVAAKAPRNLRRHTARILLIDEADGMEVTAEGSPLVLAERRTLSFANRKIILGSTPTFEETSHVLRSYANSDKRVFEVPCQSCGTFHEIEWGHIEWEPNKPETASFRCPTCKELIAERFKTAMVEQGLWRATAPHVKGHAGFRLNALVSGLANATWAKLAAEFITAKEHPDQLQTFVNTILAQGWKESGEEIDDAQLMARAEGFGLEKIPDEVLLITGGCDCQDDRIEITFLGWTRGGEILVLGHTVAWGSVNDDSTWSEVDEVLRTTFKHPRGGTLKVQAVAIDSGDGGHSEIVYKFCGPRFNRKVFAIKGDGGKRPIITPAKSKTQGGRLFIVGVDEIKSHLMLRLSRGETIRFSKSLEPVWYEQLTNERRVIRYVKGMPQRRFERKPGARVEALDCFVYAFAVRHLLNTNWDELEKAAAYVPDPGVPKPTNTRVTHSKFLNRFSQQ